MRKYLRSSITPTEAPTGARASRYQAAVLAAIPNLSELAQSLAAQSEIDEIGKALADSRPLAVLGLRASAILAREFEFYASKDVPLR